MADIPKITLGLKKVVTITDNTELTLDHADARIYCNNSGGAKTITIPADATVDLPIGTEILVYMGTSNPITITAANDVTINSAQYGNSDAVLAEIRAVARLTKIAADEWAIDGQLGRQVEVFIPIDWAEDGAAPPEAAAAVASGTGAIRGRNFASDSSEDVIINWRVPSLIYEASGITYKVHTVVTNATGPSSEGVVFSLSGFSLGSNDGIDGTYGSEVTSSFSSNTASQYDVLDTDESAAVTVTDLMRDEVAMLKLYRDHDAAGDDYAQDIAVTGITIKYYVRY